MPNPETMIIIADPKISENGKRTLTRTGGGGRIVIDRMIDVGFGI